MNKLRKEFESIAIEIYGDEISLEFSEERNCYIYEKTCNAFALFSADKTSQWITVEDDLPAYGDPVLLKISGVVQHVTYMLDGSDESCDWFEPYHYEDTDAAVDNNGSLRIEWMPLPRSGE